MATPLGNDDDRVPIIGVGSGTGGASTGSVEIVVVDPKGTTKVAPSGVQVNNENIIGVEMADLTEKEQKELELQREMEEVMAERRKKKLACFQKTRSGMVKKGDTVKASMPVNSPFTLEELVHMIDVTINSKYGADLEVITRTLTESVWGSVKSLRLEFKKEYEKMPRQIRSMVQQVLGEARGKRDSESPGASTTIPNFEATNLQGIPANLGRVGNRAGTANSNLQQPYYQAHAYGPGAPQLVPDAYFPRPPVFPAATCNKHTGMLNNVREQVARTLREFGLGPKGWVRTYQKPYPEIFDTMPYPRGCRVLDFGKFTGEDSKSTYKHVGQFLGQVNDFGIMDVHRVRLFSFILVEHGF
jgi:hypothetical protein